MIRNTQNQFLGSVFPWYMLLQPPTPYGRWSVTQTCTTKKNTIGDGDKPPSAKRKRVSRFSICSNKRSVILSLHTRSDFAFVNFSISQEHVCIPCNPLYLRPYLKQETLLEFPQLHQFPKPLHGRLPIACLCALMCAGGYPPSRATAVNASTILGAASLKSLRALPAQPFQIVRKC